MNTTQNRAMVLALFLRAALEKLATVRPERWAQATRPDFDAAVEEINAVATELEETAKEGQ